MHDDYEDVPPTPPFAPKRARPAICVPPFASSLVVRTHIQQVIFDAIEAVTDAENAAVQSEYLATSAARTSIGVPSACAKVGRMCGGDGTGIGR